MTDRVHDGVTKVWHAASVANISAPTVAEITGATEITAFVTKDGLRVPNARNFADTSSLATTTDTEKPGTKGGRLGLTLKRGTPDTAWELFNEGTTGYIIVGRNSPTPEAGDIVEVYPIESHEPAMADTAPNESQKFTVECAITGDWDRDAVVAA